MDRSALCYIPSSAVLATRGIFSGKPFSAIDSTKPVCVTEETNVSLELCKARVLKCMDPPSNLLAPANSKIFARPRTDLCAVCFLKRKPPAVCIAGEGGEFENFGALLCGLSPPFFPFR